MLLLLSPGCAKVRWSFPEYNEPPLLMAGQMNARAHILVITLTVGNAGGNGVVLFPKEAVVILPGGRRIPVRQHVNRGVTYTTDSVALRPRERTKVRFDVQDDDVDFTELDELTIEWPPMLMDAQKGETTGETYTPGSSSSTAYKGNRLQLPPTVIRRVKN